LDNLQRLIGIVSIQDILSANDDKTISDIMDEKVISVREDTDQEEAVKIMQANDLVSLPVGMLLEKNRQKMYIKWVLCPERQKAICLHPYGGLSKKEFPG